MTYTYHIDTRFRGDLWGSTRAQRQAIARDLYGDGVRVHTLRSGTYMTVEHEDRTTTTVGLSLARSHGWDMWRRDKGETA